MRKPTSRILLALLLLGLDLVAQQNQPSLGEVARKLREAKTAAQSSKAVADKDAKQPEKEKSSTGNAATSEKGPAEDGQTIKSKNDLVSCEMSVPATWKTDVLGTGARSPDGSTFAQVSPLAFHDSDPEKDYFALANRAMQKAFPQSKLSKVSDAEFEMEGTDNRGMPHVLRSIAISRNTFCGAEVIYESGTADDAWRIARTLRASK